MPQLETTKSYCQRLIGGLIVAALIFHGRAFAADADPFLYQINWMKKAVAPIVCLRPPQPGQTVRDKVVDGSVFFISARGDFLTAGHALTDFAKDHPLAGCDPVVWFDISTDGATMTVEAFKVDLSNCVSDPVMDVARCKTIGDLTTYDNGKFKPNFVTLDGDRRPDGTPIAVTGFPLFNTVPITSRGYIAGYHNDPRGLLVLDHAAWPGDSGSPVYDENGKVVGMMILAGENFAAGLSYAVSGAALLSFMAAHPMN